MKVIFITLSFIITSSFVEAQDLGDPGCDSLLLVSSWSRGNVKIYDGCDGSYVRDLAENGILSGPQTIFQDNNGDVIVVSESNHKLVKFNQSSLSSPVTVLPSGVMNNPITIVKKDDENIYLGSYSSNKIIELNTTSWQSNRTVLPANNGQIQGIDIGMAMGPDNQLYVPGYDSDSILKVDPISGATSQFVSSGSNGLDRPRSILFLEDRILVTAWGNAAILSYSLDGQFLGSVVNNFLGVAGMIADGPDHILVTSDTLNTVRRYQLDDFSFTTIISNNSGGLTGATFVYRLEKITTTTEVSGIRQAWVTGVGNINGTELLVESFTTTGGSFGDDFDPDDIANVFWGQLLLKFTGCHSATMSYQSDLSIDGIHLGNGSYQIERLAMNPSGCYCDEIGFDLMTDAAYMNGTFFGGNLRQGEGFTIDYLNENQAVVTWFTYLPSDVL